MNKTRKTRKSPYPTREEWKKRFAILLRERMEYLKIDQVELAKRCEISQQSVCGYTQGRCAPNAYTLFKLCIVLAVNPDYFMM